MEATPENTQTKQRVRRVGRAKARCARPRGALYDQRHDRGARVQRLPPFASVQLSTSGTCKYLRPLAHPPRDMSVKGEGIIRMGWHWKPLGHPLRRHCVTLVMSVLVRLAPRASPATPRLRVERKRGRLGDVCYRGPPRAAGVTGKRHAARAERGAPPVGETANSAAYGRGSLEVAVGGAGRGRKGGKGVAKPRKGR